MGRFNTYQSDLKYTPQSFEKLAALPMQLRKDHDKFIADSELAEVGWNHTNVAAGFEETVGKKRAVFDAKSKDLSARLAKEGAGNPELVNEFRQMKRDYNKEASATGVLGQGARRFKEEKESEQKYTEYGVTKALQGSKIVAEQWNDKMKKENDAIREGYANDPNFIPKEMVHEYAPGKYTVTDFALKVTGLMGLNSNSSSWETINGKKVSTLSLQEMMSAVSFENGVPIINQNSEAWSKNEEQVKMFAELTKSELANPSSDLHKHLAYNKQDMGMFLKDIEYVAGMMLQEKTADTSTFKGLPGGDPSGGDTTPAPPVKEQAALMKIHSVGEDLNMAVPGYNGGEKFELTPQNAGTVLSNLDQIIERSAKGSQADKDAVSDPKFNVAHSAALSLALKEKELERQFPGYKARAFEKYYNNDSAKHTIGMGPTAGFVGTANQMSAEGVMPTSYEGFRKKIDQSREVFNRMIEGKQTTFRIVNRKGDGSSEISIAEGLKILDEQEKAVYNGMTEHYEQGAKKLLVSSDNYTFTAGAASSAVHDRENKFLTKEFGGILEEAGRTQSIVYSTDPLKIGIQTMDMAMIKGRGTPVSVQLASITTAGINGYPGLKLKVTHKVKGGEAVSYVDLGLNDSEGKANYARQIFTDILKNTEDPETRALLNIGLENSRATKITSKYVADMGKGEFNAATNKQITAEAAASGLRNQTVNANGSSVYESIQDGNGYYGISIAPAKKGVPTSSDYRMYSVNDFINDNVNAANLEIKENQLKAKAAQIALFMKPKQDGSEPKDAFGDGVMRPSRSLGDRETMFNAIKEYNDQMYEKAGETKRGISHHTSMAIAREFIDKIKNIGIMSRSKLMFINRSDDK